MKAEFIETNQHKNFAELKPTEMFCWHGSVYIKLRDNADSENSDFTFPPNAIGIFDREFWYVGDATSVEIVTCELSDESEERKLIC